ncbi:hypothetical protein E4U14_001302 [Claviceps sp. LM454 group G7]|nr:hypothetical protein E4U14_001302 [Claviceps sp. LM454 group G7]
MARLGGSWDHQLRKEFEIADGKASDIVLGSLSPEDQGFFQDVQSAKDLWISLQESLTGVRTIVGNWAKIQDYRRRLINSDVEMKAGYNDNVLYRMFVKALPDVYKPLLDSLKPRQITVAEKLAYLYEKEGELNPKGDDSISDVEEAGHIARYGGGKFVTASDNNDISKAHPSF